MNIIYGKQSGADKSLAHQEKRGRNWQNCDGQSNGLVWLG